MTPRARTGWRLSEAELRDWMDALIDEGLALVGPAGEGDLVVFRKVSSAVEVRLDVGTTRWSPKEHLLPRSEPLYAYELRGSDVSVAEVEPDGVRAVLFGVRSCDASGLEKLDDVFLHGEVDRLYAARRSASTVVTLACRAARPECFCTAVGGSPAGRAGSDVVVHPLADCFVLQPASEKGRELVGERSSGWQQASEEDWREVGKQCRQVEKQMRRPPLAPDLSERLEQSFDGPQWWEYGERCLGCTVCASVCPSCSCFDVHQEGEIDRGVQLRCWDGCTLARFTLHASGHNPRADRAARFRQRVMHKFAYSGSCAGVGFRCVGCGRCIDLCPAGIDLYEAAVSAALPSTTGGDDGRV